jgi:hypothetical protein
MRKYVHLATLLAIAIPLAVGAFLAFPVYDDGYVMLFLREPGIPFSVANRDRPIPGAIHGALLGMAGNHKILYILLNAVLWLLFALEARALFRRIFPELERWAILAACLTIAPVVVQTQISVIVVDGTATFFTMVSYAVILACLARSQTNKVMETVLLTLVFAVAAFAAFASEYAVLANLAGAVLLVGLALSSSGPRRRSLLTRGAVLLLVTITAYFVFMKTADFSVRPDVDPTTVIGSASMKPVAMALNAISGVWYSVIAAYASALGRITLSWGSKSSIIGLVYGLVIVALLWLSTAKEQTGDEGAAKDHYFKRVMFLIVAILAGLGPIAFMGRSTTLPDYESRFRIPILPLAATLTAFLLIKMVPRSKVWIPITIVGLIIGDATIRTVYGNVQQTRTIDALGPVIKPYVEKTQGITVAVVPIYRLQNELNAHVTSAWPQDLERRFWLYNEETAKYRFGSRGACRSNLAVKEKIRPIERSGPVSQLLWIELEPGKAPSIQPYCLSGYQPNESASPTR